MKKHLRGWLQRCLEPQILFPAIAVVVVAIIWGTTFSYLRMQRVDIEHAAQISTRENVETYEAQVIRALNQIDQALDIVTWAHGQAGRHTLAELRDNDLLPPDLLFIVTTVDRNGVVTDSTRADGPKSVVDRDYFEAQRTADAGVFVGQPRPDSGLDARVNFSRRLTATDGSFDGIVAVVVDAAYFVSGYEPVKLGERGTLALLGNDGRIRVRRSGDRIGVDGSVDVAALQPQGDEGESPVTLLHAPWDGEDRWISLRPLYGFPLSVMAGLSRSEQRTLGERNVHLYLWLATVGSVLAIACLSLLGRLSWQLMMSRRRESESQREHARRVEFLAYHDGLTELPNRSLFSRLLTDAVTEARRHQLKLAVAFIDLDRFKSINDTLGHDAGDELLREVARRLKASVRPSDTVARLGGDEFVLLLPQIGGAEDAAAVAKKIVSAMTVPVRLRGREMRVTCSIGISLCPQDGIDEQTLKKHADIAMYEAKSSGRNNFQFYDTELSATTQVEFQRLLTG